MFNAFNKYKAESINIKAKATDIFFFLQESRLLSTFDRILVQKKLIKTSYSFTRSANKVLFNSIDGFRNYSTLIKYKQYIEEFNKHYTI